MGATSYPLATASGSVTVVDATNYFLQNHAFLMAAMAALLLPFYLRIQ